MFSNLSVHLLSSNILLCFLFQSHRLLSSDAVLSDRFTLLHLWPTILSGILCSLAFTFIYFFVFISIILFPILYFCFQFLSYFLSFYFQTIPLSHFPFFFLLFIYSRALLLNISPSLIIDKLWYFFFSLSHPLPIAFRFPCFISQIIPFAESASISSITFFTFYLSMFSRLFPSFLSFPFFI